MLNKSIQKIFLFLPLVLFFSCGQGKGGDSQSAASAAYTVEYAQGFRVDKRPDCTLVTVRDPWDTARVLQQYVLVERTKKMPDPMPAGKLIRTPLENVVAYSTLHCATLKELGAISIIRGVCESQYIDIPEIRQGVTDGSIPDFGAASNPDVEQIILLSPEAIFATPIQGMPYGTIEKTGIPMIETPDYMEAAPLGRAEWVRFYSLFVGKEALGDSLFQETVNRYNEVKHKVEAVTERPSVFMDLKYGNVWYMAGGQSFMANMIKDAGGDYIWSDDSNIASLPLAFEAVLDKAGEADLWLIKYNTPEDLTYPRLAKEFQPYSHFRPFRERHIYACNTGKATYYEDLPIHPDYVLNDFAAVFHPELFPGYQPRYYHPVKE